MTLRGALYALGVPVKTPTMWYGDNLGMLQSTGLPDSTLKKRHMSISSYVQRTGSHRSNPTYKGRDG